jgi:succinyl-diaminopimelate desuccinylase
MSEIQTLGELVSINSVFPNEQRLAEHIEKRLGALGFSVRRVGISEGRFNIIGQRGERGSPVLFYGHIDTVPVYGKWSTDPFTLTEKDGRLYGLGAYDMKAGVAALLCAFEEKTDRKIRVAFGVDEENESAGGWKLFNEGVLDNVEGIVTTEIGDISDENAGTRTVTLGRRGRAVYEFRVPGKSIHGAHSSGEPNALSEASRLALALERMNEDLPKHELLPAASQFVSRINCEATSLSTPAEAVVVLDRHLIVGETAESALGQYQELLERLYSEGELSEVDGQRITVGIKERRYPYLMPYLTAKDNKFAQKFSDSVRSEVGEPIYNYGWSVADESILASTGIPLVTLPPIGGNEHQADEWVSKKSYLEIIKVLRSFIRSM